MAKQTFIKTGLSQLRSYLSTLEGTKKPVFILFTGDKDDSGKSWCPDCNVADPVIQRNLKNLSENSEFITCYVGDRATWKNQQNEFRLDKEFQLKCVPTLIQWKKNKILKEEQCADDSLLQMLFEDE